MKSEAKIKNFTPLLDNLVKEFGIVTAAVYGRVWRYAQGENKVCQAAQETIADELGIGRQTVIRHLKILEENKYLVDHTPELRHRPHTYSVTDKAHIVVVVEAVIDGVPESNTLPPEVYQNSTPGVPESNTRCTTESLKETIKETIKDTYIQDNKLSCLAEKEYFTTFGRKRWSNKVQQELFYKLLSEYGETELIKAVKWAAVKNISDLSRIEKALQTMAKSKTNPEAKNKSNEDGSMYV